MLHKTLARFDDLPSTRLTALGFAQGTLPFLLTLSIFCCKPSASHVRQPSVRRPSAQHSEAPSLALSAPIPEGSRTQGSFSVWTDPSRPNENQDFKLFVRLKLPTNLKTLAKEDITGELNGSDGYFQSLHGTSGTIKFKAEYGFATQIFAFEPAAGLAQLGLSIPGRGAGVKDVLTIKSVVANESQSFTFEPQHR
ncbi:MAG: hypothetical protein NTV34_05305 [Proteobacteria bacterium]|nr:hypothetical protein [Pseudomonadota bacterium]